MGPEQVERIGRVRVDATEALADAGRDRRRIGQLGERRQGGSDLAQAGDRPVDDARVDDLALESDPSHR
jgi:hypothetical protein